MSVQSQRSTSSEGDAPQAQRVFVGGISFQADESQLRQFFEAFGPILDVRIIRERETNASKGYGFVTFADAATAQLVRNKGHLAFMNKTMNVSDAYRKHQRQAQPASRHLPMPADAAGAGAAAQFPYMVYAAPQQAPRGPQMYSMQPQQYPGVPMQAPYVYYIPPQHLAQMAAAQAGYQYTPQAFYPPQMIASYPPAPARQTRPARQRHAPRQPSPAGSHGNAAAVEAVAGSPDAPEAVAEEQ